LRRTHEKKYIAYLDDGESVIKVAVPANNAAGVKRDVAGNGEIVKIKDVTEEYPTGIGENV
jgi:hypothetical protein